MGMILRIASSRIVGQGDIVGRSGYFSLNLSANSVMRGRLDARRTLKSLVADLRILNKFDNDKLIDIVKNYKRYGYNDALRNYVINLLEERGWSREDLQRFGYLTNNNYDEAEKQYKAYKRNSLIGICTLVFSGGILIIVYLIFLIMAYRNVARFYKALGRNEDETALFNALGVLAYFHLKEKMKEELKGIR